MGYLAKTAQLAIYIAGKIYILLMSTRKKESEEQFLNYISQCISNVLRNSQHEVGTRQIIAVPMIMSRCLALQLPTLTLCLFSWSLMLPHSGTAGDSMASLGSSQGN